VSDGCPGNEETNSEHMKRRYDILNHALFLLAVLMLASASTALGQTADCWGNFRGDEQLKGVSSANIPDRPELLWTFSTGDAGKRHRGPGTDSR